MDSILCLESGGTKLVAAIGDSEGRIVERKLEYRRPDQPAADTVSGLIRMGRALAAGRTLTAVSWGYGGLVDRRRGRPADCFHEAGWDAVEPMELLREAFAVPVFVENDCKLAALAEALSGAGRGSDRVLYVTIGTGIGAGYVRNGRILELGGWGEMELGHVVVEPGGPECPCGSRGCLETLASGPGLATLCQRMGRPDWSAKDLMYQFRHRDLNAVDIVNCAAQYLGWALAAAINLTAPQCVILGGGVMTANHPYLELVEATALLEVFPRFRGELRFAVSELGEAVVCQGAALFARQRLASSTERPDLQ